MVKKPKSPYMSWFWSKGIKEIESKNKNLEQKDKFKEGGKLWSKMSNADKKSYQDKYDKEMKKYNSLKGSQSKSKSKSKKSKNNEKKSKKKSKKKQSPYMKWLWSSQGVEKVKKENPNISHTDAVKKASKIWKNKSK